MTLRVLTSIQRSLAGLAILMATLSPTAAAADVYPSHLPVMTGTTGEPMSVNMGAPVAYVVTQTDKDTNIANQQFIDTTCMITNVELERMTYASLEYSLRGVDGNGTYTWDVTGTAAVNPGVKRDKWRLFNQRNQGDILKDPNLDVVKVVTVNGMPPP
jgi:hypothetical protein